jgi:hypothetical protein
LFIKEIPRPGGFPVETSGPGRAERIGGLSASRQKTNAFIRL